MKKIALCMGFCYRDTASPLTSTYADLWTATEYLSQKGFYCYIITDCDDIGYVNRVYTDRSLNASFLNFHLSKSSPWFTKTTYDSTLLAEALTETDQFFFYYTGHITSNGDFEFPTERFSIASVFCDFSDLLPSDAQVLAVIDGCYSGNHPFSHTIIEDELCLTKHSFPMRQQCIYLYSSDPLEKAVSSTFQSYFTKYFFRELRECTSNLLVLLEKLQGRLNYRTRSKGQTLGAAMSMPMPLLLWPWVFGLKFELRSDYVILF